MLPYIVLTFIIATAAVLLPKPRSSATAGLAITLAIGMASIAGLRFDVGYDFGNYVRVFELSAPLTPGATSVDDSVVGTIANEPGYRLLNRVAKSLFGDSGLWFVLLVSSAATATLAIAGLYRYSPYPFLALLFYFGVYYLPQGMGQIRQALAIGLIALTPSLVIERKPIAFFSIVLFAASFHYTALTMLPLYWYKRLSVSYRTLGLLLAAAIIAGLSGVLGSVVVRSLGNLEGLGPFLHSRVTRYVLSGESYEFSVGLVQRLLTALLVLTFHGRYRSVLGKRQGDLLMKMFLVSVIGYFLFFDFEIIAGRMFLPLKWWDAVILSATPRLFARPATQMLCFVTLFGLFIFIITAEIFSAPVYLPYKSYLFE